MTEEIHTLTQRVSQLENEVKVVAELKQQVHDLTGKLAAPNTAGGLVDQLKQQVGDLDARLAAKCVAEEDAAVSCTLRWHGVPQAEGENLKTLFNRLCFSLHLTPPPLVRSIYRVRPRQTGQTLVDPIIHIKMEHVREKATLLRAIGAYRRTTKTQLSLQLIGLESPALIYINEQLTKHNYEVFKRAMHLKKHKRLTAVFTRRGDVFVKMIDGVEAHNVRSLHELSELSNNLGGPSRNSSFRD
ncbi:uncharacterized protein [Drosophila takahashii]|uniref:uncharacterized protein n=1 Tax=Drosophila takahashii TaxID=29030 RepID=UPI0038992A1C